MAEKEMTTKKSLLVLGSLILFIVLTLITPAKWFGIGETKKSNNFRLDLSSDIPASEKVEIPDSWKELALNNIPEDEIKKLESQKPDPEVIAQLNDPNNLTASFSKNMYIASTYLSKNPAQSADEQQEILNKLMAQEAAKIVPTVYTYKDLTLAKSESNESIKAYGNSVAKILDNMITEKSITEGFNGLEEYTKTKNERDLLPLEQDSKRLDTIIKKLLALSIPPSASVYHLAAINAIAEYKDLLYNLSTAASDPVRATLFMDKITSTFTAALRVHQQLAIYFDVKNIVFSSKDSGYVFTVGYTLK
jgi:hypothetical protein